MTFLILLFDSGVCLPVNNGNALNLKTNHKSNHEKSKLSWTIFSWKKTKKIFKIYIIVLTTFITLKKPPQHPRQKHISFSSMIEKLEQQDFSYQGKTLMVLLPLRVNGKVFFEIDEKICQTWTTTKLNCFRSFWFLFLTGYVNQKLINISCGNILMRTKRLPHLHFEIIQINRWNANEASVLFSIKRYQRKNISVFALHSLWGKNYLFEWFHLPITLF